MISIRITHVHVSSIFCAFQAVVLSPVKFRSINSTSDGVYHVFVFDRLHVHVRDLHLKQILEIEFQTIFTML